MCQVSDRESRDQVHTVEILVPASVRAAPEGGRVVARRGGGATLECRAAGNPVPSVIWTRMVSNNTYTFICIYLEKLEIL